MRKAFSMPAVKAILYEKNLTIKSKIFWLKLGPTSKQLLNDGFPSA